MANKIYALLVGIDDYPPPIPRLYGCLNDVNHVRDFLRDSFGDALCLQILKNSDAQRENIIKLFRDHLAKADKDDVVFFHYSGHGSRELAAPEFAPYFPDGLDETIVCYDSRKSNGHDLADKEMAVLIQQITKNNPHTVISLDCCHSGSGTRDSDDFNLGETRQTTSRAPGTPRPLETYLDGWYKQSEHIHIPDSNHLLIAACHRTQTAKETRDHRGVYTTALLDVLTHTGPDITYADLFVKCRWAVLKNANDQTPQFEPHRRFLPHNRFLNPGTPPAQPRHHVYMEDRQWKMDCGALHGLPTTPDQHVRVALYPFPGDKTTTTELGHGEALTVGAQTTTLKLDFAATPGDQYGAEIIGMPDPPLPLYLQSEGHLAEQIKNALPQRINAAFTDDPRTARFTISTRDDALLLTDNRTRTVIQGAWGETHARIDYIYSLVEKIIRWERTLALQNHHTKIKKNDLRLELTERIPNTDNTDDTEQEYCHKGEDVTLDLVEIDGVPRKIRARLSARNLGNRPLYLALFYLSEKYGIHLLANEPVPPRSDPIVLWGNEQDDYFHLPPDVDEAQDTFKLIAATTPVDDFLLVQKEMEPGKIITLDKPRDIGTINPVQKLLGSDWCARTMRVRTVRRLRRLGEQDTILRGANVTIKGHTAFKADLSLVPTDRHQRGRGRRIIASLLEKQHGKWAREFNGHRSGENTSGSILELSHIENETTLRTTPLHIHLKTVPPKNQNNNETDGIYLLPLAFDGMHLLPVGYPHPGGTDRETILPISHLPVIRDATRHGRAKALDLYFLKIELPNRGARQLRRLEYTENGQIHRHPGGIEERALDARHIILLLDGILRDTTLMAAELAEVGRENTGEEWYHPESDLVLTYDYDPLFRPLEETARHLRSRLEEVGFYPGGPCAGKAITIIARGIGGILARQFITDGIDIPGIRRLITIGTPTNGFPLTNTTQYRNLALAALTMALNNDIPLVPHACALLKDLTTPERIPPAPAQTVENSPYMQQLNHQFDPATSIIPWTRLPGPLPLHEKDRPELLKAKIREITGETDTGLFQALGGHCPAYPREKNWWRET